MNAEAMPKIFLRTSKLGIPLAGVGVSFCFGLLAFLSVSSGSNQAFVWLSNLSALSSLIGWISICVCYLRFKKALAVQGKRAFSCLPCVKVRLGIIFMCRHRPAQTHLPLLAPTLHCLALHHFLHARPHL